MTHLERMATEARESHLLIEVLIFLAIVATIYAFA